MSFVDARLQPPGTLGRLVVAVMLLFFSNAVLYGPLVLGWPVQPVHWIVILAALAIVFLLRSRALEFISEPFALWTLVYLSIMTAWFVGFGAGQVDAFKTRWLFTLLALFAYFTFRAAPSIWDATQSGMKWLVIACVVVNAYDITHPFALVPAHVDGVNPGRAAGLYINANQAGAALVLGTLIALDRVPKRWQVAFLTISLVGVVLTVSRSAILGWLIAMTVVVGLRGAVSGGRLVKAGLLTLVLGAVAWSIVSPRLEDLGISASQLLERFEWFTSRGASQDFSHSERERLVAQAWSAFVSHPWLGLGPGATDAWATHNLYLTHLVEFGILGVLVLPGFIFAAMWGAPVAHRPVAVATALFVLWWAMFDHGVLFQFAGLIGIAWIAAGSRSRSAASVSVTDVNDAPGRHLRTS
jgi:O-antigen ligase